MVSAVRRPLGLGLFGIVLAALSLLVALVVYTPGAEAAEDGPVICLIDSNGNGLAGGSVYHRTSGSWGSSLGTTGADGCVTIDPKTTETRLRLTYQRGAVETGVVDFSEGYTFETVKVTVVNNELIRYQGYYGGFGAFTSPMEMLPGTYTFADYYHNNRVNITVGTEDLTVGIVRLVDHQGNALAGGTATAYVSGWYNVPGETDANGYLVFPVASDSPNLNVRMQYKGTAHTQNRSQLNASKFTFRTALTTVKLQNADGNPLDTGSVTYYADGWRTFGSGATSGGEVSQEMLPGNYAFAMRYNAGLEQRNGVPISGPTTDVVFQTGRLTMHYSGEIRYFGGNWHLFQKPVMEFLPGEWRFYLGGYAASCSIDLDIASGDKLVKSAIAARLTSSTNDPLAGGTVTAYAGSWKTLGETNSAGWVCAALDGKLGNTSVKMTHNGTAQTLAQHHPTNSVYNFKTAAVTVELVNSDGTRIDTGSASYYAGSWRSLGDTQSGVVTTQMLPGKYSFAMVYNGTREQKNSVEIQASGTTVTFETTAVTVALFDSNDSALPGGSSSYYAGKWWTIDSSGEVQMLPGKYSFAMVYNGTREQKNNIEISGSDVTVPFQTVAVTVALVDSDGNSLDGGAASYYAGKWWTLDSLGEVEMLSGKYSFAMVYEGTREQRNNVQISGPETTVTFQTGKVHSESGNATGYYAGAWRPFEQDMELLSGKYTFRFSDQGNTAYTLGGNGETTTIH